jgi:hypothetical protein
MQNIIKKLLRENLEMLSINEITSDKAWETFYSDIKKFPLFNGNKEMFDKLDALYPKRNEQFNKGYFEFLYNLLKTNQLKDEDFYKAKQYLELFNKNISKIPADKRNVQQYKTLPDLYDIISDFEGTENELSKTQQLKNVREKEIERVYEDGEWRVLVPKTEQASCLVGKGTQWCTAADKSDNRFNLYNNQGKLYVVINKGDDSKYQLHFEDGQLMDARNRALPATYFFEHVLENAALEDWFQKERDDFYDFILKTSTEDISSGGYSELFQDALNSASDQERQEALNTLRNGSDADAVAEGFLWEKDPYNIQDYQIENYIENFSDDEMFPRVIEHLKEIGVDFDDDADGTVRVLLQGFDDLKKHKLETDREYKIDKKRTLRILSVNTEKDFPRYKIRINGTDGLVPLDGLLSYLNNKSLFENILKESATKKEVIDFILDFNYLLSLNLAMVKNQAKDEKSKLALIQMQQKFKTPVINGKTFFELADERITPRKDLFNPKFLSAYLTQIRNYLVYVKEHINRFVVDGIYKTGWLDRISKLEATYKNIIGANQISEDENCELTEKCWKGYTQKGMKTMFGKRYPNCVKKTK